jgi:hypothetical protein
MRAARLSFAVGEWLTTVAALKVRMAVLLTTAALGARLD